MGVHGCAQVCVGVLEYAQVCAGLHGCVLMWMGVREFAQLCVGVRKYVWVCMGVRWSGGINFQNTLLETRFLTSANYNMHPLRIFSIFLLFRLFLQDMNLT